ncbi:CvpA family protein [Candidatus Pelagibacter sp.]|nr:CvpA family protein [Candidatus Pelagibacter sp.]
MSEQVIDILNKILIFDLIFIILTILSLLKCTSKGFVLSLLSASKWLLAYVITLLIFPRVKPYVDDIIDNEYVLDVILGGSIFVLIIFLILMINKGISRAISYTGIGTLDKIFGFFFGFLRAYVISICIFATIDIIYNHEKWPIDLDQSYSFPYVLKGSNYLIKEFPDEKDYQDTKEKVQEL